MKEQIITDEEASCHEAGHAVVCYHYNVPFIEPNIDRREFTYGSIKIPNLKNKITEIIIRASGYAAEVIYRGDSEIELLKRLDNSRLSNCGCVVRCDYCELWKTALLLIWNKYSAPLKGLKKRSDELGIKINYNLMVKNLKKESYDFCYDFCRNIIIRTKKFLESPYVWKAVKALATEFLEKGKLDKDQAIEIISKYNPDKRQI